jgi:cell division protein FtsN
MDDLVVIIITLLIVVVGVLNQRKKRQQAQQASPGSPGQPADFWDMIMRQEEVSQPFFQPEPAIEFSEEDEPEPAVQPGKKYQFNPQNEGTSEIKEVVKMMRNTPKKEVLIEGERFSPRKAIIYSEIMNRKYS